jgi:hypothetical protein
MIDFQCKLVAKILLCMQYCKHKCAVFSIYNLFSAICYHTSSRQADDTHCAARYVFVVADHIEATSWHCSNYSDAISDIPLVLWLFAEHLL